MPFRNPENFPYGPQTQFFMDRGGRIVAGGPGSTGVNRIEGERIVMPEEFKQAWNAAGSPQSIPYAEGAVMAAQAQGGSQGQGQGQGQSTAAGAAPFDPFFNSVAYRSPIQQGVRAGYAFPGFGRDPELQTGQPAPSPQPEQRPESQTEPEASPEPEAEPTPEPQQQPSPLQNVRAEPEHISSWDDPNYRNRPSYQEMTASDPQNLSDYRVDLNARNFITDNVPWWGGLGSALLRGAEYATRGDFDAAGRRMFDEDGESFMEAMGPVDQDGGIFAGGTSRSAFADLNRNIGPQQMDNQAGMEPVSNFRASAQQAGLIDDDDNRLRSGYVPPSTMASRDRIGTPSMRPDATPVERPSVTQQRGMPAGLPAAITGGQPPSRPGTDPELNAAWANYQGNPFDVGAAEAASRPGSNIAIPDPNTDTLSRPQINVLPPTPPSPPPRPQPSPSTGGGGGGGGGSAPINPPRPPQRPTPPPRPQPPPQQPQHESSQQYSQTGQLTGGQQSPMGGGSTVPVPSQKPTPPSGGGGGGSFGSGGGSGGQWTNPDVGRPTRPGEVTTGPGQSNQSSGGGGGGGGGKIVCTAMNNAYGFGGFRNAIWLKYAAENLTKEHEVGYHTLFQPLVSFAYGSDGRIRKGVRSVLEHIARRRTSDLWGIRKGRRDRVGQIERAILEPICFGVGWLKLRAKEFFDAS